MRSHIFLLRVVLVVLTVVVVFFSGFIALLTDWWWFSEVHFQNIFLTTLWAKLGTGVGAGLFAALFMGVHLLIATRSRSHWQALIPEQLLGTAYVFGAPFVRAVALFASIVIGIFAGLGMSGAWQDVLRFIHATPFGAVDPLFGLDLSFTIFSLPVFSLALGLLQFLTIISLLACGIIYFFQGALVPSKLLVFLSRFGRAPLQVEDMGRKVRVHLGILLSLFFAGSAAGALIAMVQLNLSADGIIFGATASQAIILRPLMMAAAGVFALSSVLSLIFAFGGSFVPLAGSVALSLAMSVVSSIAPAVYQKIVIAPNELQAETPYIKNNIASTRAAYGLGEVDEREIAAERALTSKDIAANSLTFKNVRLWDSDPLLSTFSQIQEIRTYYEFHSVDNDRYMIDDELRQIMLSPRELSPESLPNRNWINERLTFTHGYGIAAGPVNQVTPEGLPVLFVKDLPPRAERTELAVDRPEIYYGEIANDYIIVKTKSLEFDYPKGEENVYTSYEGSGGVQLSSFFHRLAYALKFGELKILLSGDIAGESRIMAHRQMSERVSKIAPFFTYDSDPYLVVANGKLYWIVDGYTTTSRYPYAQPISFKEKTVNYVRNSVKAVVDAYNGTVDFYMADEKDPLMQTYARVYPGVFKPLAAMPEALRSHLRYPEDIFAAQTAVYATYHMEDPQIFYNKEDLWEITADVTTRFSGAKSAPAPSQSMAPSHMIMKLPGERTEEFILMTPFTPRSKDNLSAWMVARNDGDHYGSLVVYRFPKDKLVFGPKQVIGRVNQDAEISRQISLWDQRGSQVIQGPLLVIPIEKSLVYVRPLYMKAEAGKIPELKRVIVAYENRVAMEETLDKALTRIFGADAPRSPSQEPSDQQSNPARPPEADSAFQKARQAYEEALKAQREGDWAQYGEQIKKLGDILRELGR